jgi:5-methyltetrahydrofolate--homocysteine methyltransferase
MVYVAKEMKRQEFETPLLIGGATTSSKHTAIKIAPEYDDTTVRVKDASRVSHIVGDLLNPNKKIEFAKKIKKEQENQRIAFEGKTKDDLVSYKEAYENRLKLDWKNEDIAIPSFIGLKQIVDYPLGKIRKYIDWTFFFSAWEMRGSYPRILNDPVKGKAATELFENANLLLDKIIEKKLLKANVAYGFWPANTIRDDIILYKNEKKAVELVRFNMLRQQKIRKGVTLSLSDFIAPKDSGINDYIGGFVVTAGINADKLSEKYENENDDYNSIMVKAIADRLAEAFAELIHQRVRKEWSFPDREGITNQDLIKERYRGIRPAFGYPACPNHEEKGKLFEILNTKKIGVKLTENYSMYPAASVSGLYFAFSFAKYNPDTLAAGYIE